MQLQDLIIFRQLYALRSINQTAKQLGYTQSNITARLQALEAEFDVPLFLRSHQGITPTAAGERFNDYAQTVLEATTQVRADMRPTPHKRQVVMAKLLFSLLVGKELDYDPATTAISVLTSSEILHLRAAADTVVTYADFRQPAYVSTGLAYLPASFWLAPNAGPAGLPTIVNSDRACPFRARTLRYLQRHPGQLVELPDWDNIMAMVRAGKGVALLPDYIGARDGLARLPRSPHYRVPYQTFRRVATGGIK